MSNKIYAGMPQDQYEIFKSLDNVLNRCERIKKQEVVYLEKDTNKMFPWYEKYLTDLLKKYYVIKFEPFCLAPDTILKVTLERKSIIKKFGKLKNYPDWLLED